ncbi:MAG: DUF305 domain-containing protein [bacterium]|nr:DUF305 domain-containing protein [bacterium]
MKRSTFYTGIMAILTAAAIGAGCQTPPAANSGNAPNSTASSTDHSGHDMSNMNGHDMTTMSDPNASSQPFDLQFIDSMIHHHDGALKMSETVIAKTQRAELKTFAQKIIEDQKKEIATMKGWRDQWYAGKPSALNMEMSGMKMSEMAESAGVDVDREFLEMMTQHHKGAVLMAEQALKKSERSEIKTLADRIINEQSREITKMEQWKQAWTK